MKLAIMQPYFLPYIGYFQLIAGVDMFIIYDNIKYTKKGWINRNRMLLNGKDAMFSLPLKNASDSLDIRERELTGEYYRRRGTVFQRNVHGKRNRFKVYSIKNLRVSPTRRHIRSLAVYD